MHTQNLANSRHKYLFVFWTNNANNVYLMFFSAKLDFFYFYFTVCLHGSFSTGIEATPWHPKGLFCHNDIILTVTKAMMMILIFSKVMIMQRQKALSGKLGEKIFLTLFGNFPA